MDFIWKKFRESSKDIETPALSQLRKEILAHLMSHYNDGGNIIYLDEASIEVGKAKKWEDSLMESSPQELRPFMQVTHVFGV